MRIVQVMLAEGLGGAERYFVDLSLALARRGHEVLAVCHPRFRQRRLLAGVPNLTVKLVHAWGSWDWFAVRSLRKTIGAFAPAVLHTHLARATHLAGRAASGVPLIVKTHNLIDLKYYRHVDRFISTTNAQRDHLLRHGVDEASIQVIPNFSAARVVAIDGRPAHLPPVVVAYGRLVAKKGFDVLLRAFRKLRDEGHRDIRLLIGGDGPELPHLRALAADLGLLDGIAFAGWIDDVGEFLARGDVFALPSRDEPFGIAVLEAMAAGCPIVATRTAGPLEILDEATAWLVSIGTVDELAAALRQALADAELRQERARLAQRCFVERYSEAAVVPRIEALYAQLAGRR